MTLLVLERRFEPPLQNQDVLNMAKSAGWCFEQHRVDWIESLLSVDGRSMVCRFESSDAESIRLALKTLDADLRVLWPATIHEVPHSGQPNVIVERTFDQPCDLAELQTREDEKQWCLDAHEVKFVRTLFAIDQRRMLCFYSAPDADAVRIAQHKAGMPVDRVWSFQQLRPSDLSA